jgi:hypothetical protein
MYMTITGAAVATACQSTPCGTQPGGDAGDDAEADPLARQRLGLFPATPEHHGVAALQSQHPLAGPRQLNQLERDIGLFRRRLATPLARMDLFGARIGHIEKLGADQRVVDDGIGLAQRVIAQQRDQSRRAGPGPHQPHGSALEGRKAYAVEPGKMPLLLALAPEPAFHRNHTCRPFVLVYRARR